MEASDFGAVRSVDASQFGAVKSSPTPAEEKSTFGVNRYDKIVGATIASGALKGLAGLEDTIHTIGQEFNRLVGLPTAEVTDLTRASDLMKKTAGHLDEYLNEQKVPNVARIPGEVVGRLPVDIVEWGPKKIGVAYATIKEAAAARERGEEWGDIAKAGAKGGLKRLILGKLLDKFSEIEKVAGRKWLGTVTRRGLGGATLGADAASSGGDTTQNITATTMGVLLTGYGGKPSAKPKINETIRNAAYRMKDGTVLEGVSHPTIYMEAHPDVQKLFAAGKMEDGFVTNTGRFVGREEGLKIAQESQQVDPSTVKEYTDAGVKGLDALALQKGLHTEDVGKQSLNQVLGLEKPAPKQTLESTPVRISGAAYKMPDGRILISPDIHPTVYHYANVKDKADIESGRAEAGFVDNNNNFLTRQQASEVSQKSGQTKDSAKSSLDASELGISVADGTPWAKESPIKTIFPTTPKQTLEQALEAEGLNRPLPKGSPEALRASLIRTAHKGDVVEPPPTRESIETKVGEHIKEAQDLRLAVADPANKERSAKMINAYEDARQRALELGESSEAAGIEGMKAAEGIKSQTPDMTPPKLTSPERDFLFRENDRINTDGFDHVNTRDALNKWLAGKIPEPADFQYLAKILGIKNTTALMMKTGKMQKEGAFGLLKQAIMAYKLKFAFDPQYFRQASAVMASHPIKYIKGGVISLKAIFSGKYSEKMDGLLEAHPNHKDAKDSGVRFLSTLPWSKEGALEQFSISRPLVHELLTLDLKKGGALTRGTNIAAHGVARAYLASERGLVTGLNYLMQELWDIQMSHYSKSGISGKQLTKYKTNYAQALNTMMKLFRFKNKDGKRLQAVSNYFLFSPSYTLSRPALMYDLATKEGARKEVAMALATTIGKTFLLSALAKMAGELWKDESGKPLVTSSLNPTSSDWGYVRSGDGKWDFGLGGGDTSWYRDLFRLATKHFENQAGVIKEVPRLETLERMAISRETALIGAIGEVLTGRDYVGNKIWESPDWKAMQEDDKSWLSKGLGQLGEASITSKEEEAAFLGAKQLLKSFVPQALGDLFNASLNAGWGGLLATTVTDAVSGTSQIYPENANISLQKAQNDAAQIEHQKDWDMLSPSQQQQIEGKYPEIGQWEQQAKFERSEKELEISVKPKEIRLPADIRRTLKDATVPYPAVSRNIGSKFFLNDVRFKAYQKLAAEVLTERIRAVKASPEWSTTLPEDRQRWITDEVESSKEQARNQLINQFEEEAE